MKNNNDAIPEVVDLGLSVKWASFNLGASKPEEYGGHYLWAGTEDVTDTFVSLDMSNCPYHTGSFQYSGWTKYNTKLSRGMVDNKTVLDPEDDVAHVKLGGKWRIPTDAEWDELMGCTWTWTSNYNGTGVAGWIVTSNKPGYTDKSIFLPAAGRRHMGGLFDAGSYGCYWSSSLYTDDPNYARNVSFNSDDIYRYHIYYRCYGISVRPVTE